MLLEFAGRAITSSSCFNTLFIERTQSSVSDCMKFLQPLADSECNQLKEITISWEERWFDGTDECMGPLLTFFAKQTGFYKLKMKFNGLSETQKDQIRQAVSVNAPNCAFGNIF